MAQQSIRRTFALSSALIMLTFAIWGMSHRLFETVFPDFVTALSLSDMQVTVTHWVRSFGYCLIAIPSAFFLRNFGYKAGVIGGLGCFAIAMIMFYPAELQHSYVFFLGAGLLANCGVALLEIAADPWVMRIGPVETSVRRLNIAQTLNPLGLLVGMMLGGRYLSNTHSFVHGNQWPVQPYLLVGLGVLLFAYLIDNVQYSPVATEREAKEGSTVADIRALWANRPFRFGLAALALYMVGQSVLWGFSARYSAGVLLGGTAVDIVSWTLYAFIFGRVVGTALMYRFDPALLLNMFGWLAAGLTGVAAFVQGPTGVWCIIAASFFMSILFPTVFGLSVRDLGKRTKSASALLIMVSGSANLLLPTILLVSGSAFSPYVVLVPCLCFGAIALFGRMHRATVPVAQPAHA